MQLFGRKLTPDQKMHLEAYATSLNALLENCNEAMNDLQVHTIDLYHICYRARAENRPLQPSEYLQVIERHRGQGIWENRVEKPGVLTEVGHLIEEAREAVKTYANFLVVTQVKVPLLRPPDWCPRGHRKAWDSWTLYFDYMRKSLSLADEALAPPDPLKCKPMSGENKLNAFVTGLGLVFQGHRDIPPKPLSSSQG